jgi:hypothetical protein
MLIGPAEADEANANRAAQEIPRTPGLFITHLHFQPETPPTSDRSTCHRQARTNFRKKQETALRRASEDFGKILLGEGELNP